MESKIEFIKRKEYYQKNREKTIKQTTEYQNKKRQTELANTYM